MLPAWRHRQLSGPRHRFVCFQHQHHPDEGRESVWWCYAVCVPLLVDGCPGWLHSDHHLACHRDDYGDGCCYDLRCPCCPCCLCRFADCVHYCDCLSCQYRCVIARPCYYADLVCRHVCGYHLRCRCGCHCLCGYGSGDCDYCLLRYCCGFGYDFPGPGRCGCPDCCPGWSRVIRFPVHCHWPPRKTDRTVTEVNRGTLCEAVPDGWLRCHSGALAQVPAPVAVLVPELQPWGYRLVFAYQQPFPVSDLLS